MGDECEPVAENPLLECSVMRGIPESQFVEGIYSLTAELWRRNISGGNGGVG
jgi:hypothetical protein